MLPALTISHQLLETLSSQLLEDDELDEFWINVVCSSIDCILKYLDDVTLGFGGGRPLGSINVQRRRVEPMEIFASLESERFIRKLYRMTQESFMTLLSLLEPTLANRKRKRGATPNGEISPASRLSQAIRYFAGGDPADIMLTHGVAYMEVYNSVWKVVDAINSCPELQITFPHNHAIQQEIANAFKAKSEVGFDNCVGCIDGMLLWTNKPNKRTLECAKIGAKKFFCGRKHKFGLNFQGVCDHLGRLMDAC